MERLRSWWGYIRNHLVATIIVVFVIIIGLIIAGYWFDWTGFNGYTKVTTTRIISGKDAGTVTRTEEYQPRKALWDWLQLLGILAIPVVVGFGAAWYTTRQSHDLEIAADNQRQSALQTFIDKIPEYKLGVPGTLAGTKEQIILHAQTLTLLPSLDANRKRILLQFLYELELICKKDIDHNYYPIIKLSSADLSEANLANLNLVRADLAQSNLSGANLSGVDLSLADLRGANLRGANLSGANLSGAIFSSIIYVPRALGGTIPIPNSADLSGANLCGANLSGAEVTDEQLAKAASLEGATMPNGDIHP